MPSPLFLVSLLQAKIPDARRYMEVLLFQQCGNRSMGVGRETRRDTSPVSTYLFASIYFVYLKGREKRDHVAVSAWWEPGARTSSRSPAWLAQALACRPSSAAFSSTLPQNYSSQDSNQLSSMGCWHGKQ